MSFFMPFLTFFILLNMSILILLASQLHHPNIIETLDMVIDHGRIYEIMEYCLVDLFHIIQSRTYTTSELNCTFAQLIQGVSYLHSLGLAHRDLKPENLCFDQMGRLKIIDFGVVDVCCEGEGKSSGLCGSVPYIAPEVWVEGEYDGQKVDIWACGVIYLTLHYHAFPVSHIFF